MSFRFLFLSLMPFFCCLVGYVGVRLIIAPREIIAPSVVGYSLTEGLTLVSRQFMYGYIIDEREDIELAPGTILDQMPAAGTPIKPYQSIGLIVACAPCVKRAPSITGLERNRATQILESLGFRVKEHRLPLDTVPNVCYAQFPPDGEPVLDGLVHRYISFYPDQIRIMPDFRGSTMGDVRLCAEKYGIIVKSAFCAGICRLSGDLLPDGATVFEQNPLPGAFVKLLPGFSLYIRGA